MSVIGLAYKASRLEAMLNNHFTKTEGVVARTTTTAKGITACIYYEGSDEYQTAFEWPPRHTAFFAADKRTPHELFTDAVGPADHWVDIQVSLDADIQAGRVR